MFYQSLGTTVIPIQHPLFETITSPPKDFYRTNTLDPTKKLLSIFPGSRHQEINRCAPIFLKAAQIINTQTSTPIQWAISIINPSTKTMIQKLIKKLNLTNIHLFTNNSHDLIQNSTLSIINSGTIALEHALLNTPCIAGYRFSWLTYLIGKTIYRKRINALKYMTLPNLILKKPIIPEFLQHHCTEKSLAKSALSLLNSSKKQNKMKENFKTIQTQ